MYTINEVRKMFDISASTLRFYENEGILPEIRRDTNGRRVYDDSQIEWLNLLVALKDTGMPLEKIKEYLHMAYEGDNTLEQRRQILQEHKQSVEEKLALTLNHLEKINNKIILYDVLVLKKDPQKFTI
ncbi:MerR family transcriptional regulator [Paenibacillus sp. LHD-117]|uniref:MerR family transcriptional regulator n=1 Tax=Paenibacillus sp. LHD-117 TaxID=3071412 RepID=UPI0027DFDC44|nr:MerR family transcriptional regulator [Paenibacillus sp. LHD-117]MDQ6421644.1 MerR family transcriptional regulator [Paenibacillus sp. LHD-117]